MIMKKLIGVLGIALIAITMFFNVNEVNGLVKDVSLTSLAALNLAHADSEGAGTPQNTCTSKCTDFLFKTCSWAELSNDNRFVTITCSDMIRK